MELLQLKYFCDAAKSQNFSKTAKKFGVPPSNISQCIKRLEKELGTALFSRKANSIYLNEKGKAFFEKIDVALKTIECAKNEIATGENQGEIKLCITANRRIVMFAVEKFRKKYPDVSIVISHKYDKNDDYDIVISDDLFESEDMERRVIISEEIALAVKVDHPIVKEKNVEICHLEKENFISMNSENSLSRVTEKFCAEKGFSPHVVIQIDDPFYMRKCVELGLGVAFVPTMSWKGLFSPEIVLKKIEGFSRHICAYKSQQTAMSKAVNDFLQVLVAEFEKEK